MNRRWGFAAAVVAIAGLAVGLALALRSSPRSDAARPLGAFTSAGRLGVSVPRGFHNYALPFDVYSPGPVGHVLTNFRVPANGSIDSVLTRWGAADERFMAVKHHDYGPPSNEVALELTRADGQACRFTCPPVRLRLPLSASQPWSQERIASGAPSYRDGYLRFRHELYYVRYWIGPDAPANDRAAVLQALGSIGPKSATSGS